MTNSSSGVQTYSTTKYGYVFQEDYWQLCITDTQGGGREE